MKMESSVLQSIREQLEKSVAELQGVLHDQLQTDHEEGELSAGGNFAGDEATQTATNDMEISQTSRTGYQLELTRHAIQKLDAGQFGDCEDCGEKIGVQRLIANPIAKRCVECQTKHENMQREKDSTPSI